MEIEKVIREIREKKGINQQVIADALNVDVAVVSNIEKGKRKLKVNELENIATALEVSVVDLITYPKVFVEKKTTDAEPMEAILQIRLSNDKKDQVLRLVFGENNIEILNK